MVSCPPNSLSAVLPPCDMTASSAHPASIASVFAAEGLLPRRSWCKPNLGKRAVSINEITCVSTGF
ncbi:hypothetical protein CF112_15005 [Aeromonas hydrophila]|nr:hypothetical protein CF112_15005 [Aeromonas hydrophila]